MTVKLTFSFKKIREMFKNLTSLRFMTKLKFLVISKNLKLCNAIAWNLKKNSFELESTLNVNLIIHCIIDKTEKYQMHFETFLRVKCTIYIHYTYIVLLMYFWE